MRSVAAIWYGRITISTSSSVNTQNRVRMFRSVRCAKNVFAKSFRSVIGLFFASAHQLVNSKLLEVFLPPFVAAFFISRRWLSRVVLA